MNMKTNIKTAFLFCLALFSACSSDNDEPGAEQQPTQQPAQEKRYPLTIDVTENPMIADGDNGGTRAPIITTSTLDKFYMSYVYGNSSSGGQRYTAVKTTEGKWITSDNNYTWPIDDDGNPIENVTWYAYTDGTFYYNNGSPYISFSDDEAAMHQKDLLVAKKVDKYSNCGGHLFFAFDHACSALRFSVKKGANLSSYTLNITDIKLCNVIKDGEYYLESNTWKLLTTKTNYTLYKSENGSSITPNENDYIVLNGTATTGDTDPYLFFIPQTLTAWDEKSVDSNAPSGGNYLQITCTITDDNDNNNQVFSGTAYYPFAATLQKGYQYNVNINIGKKHLYKIENGNKSNIIN